MQLLRNDVGERTYLGYFQAIFLTELIDNKQWVASENKHGLPCSIKAKSQEALTLTEILFDINNEALEVVFLEGFKQDFLELSCSKEYVEYICSLNKYCMVPVLIEKDF